MQQLRMPIVRRPDGYWITEVPLVDCSECGPYDRKGDAADDRRGLRAWFKRAKLPKIPVTQIKEVA